MGYSLAAQFTSERSAERAMHRVKRELARTNPELSAFLFYSEPQWYVAIVGEETDMRLFARLARLLQMTGRIIPLPEETHDTLLAKRDEGEIASVP